MKRCAAVIIAIAFIFSFFRFSAMASEGAFVIINGVTLAVLEQDNMNRTLPMASTTKIMTALVVLENVSLGEIVTVSADSVGIEGSSLYIKAGESYTVEELLYGLMLRSANDCADALARYVGGVKKMDFIAMMNQRALEMGLKNTSFKNPSGLPEKGHYTTALELAKILCVAMENEEFQKITATKSGVIKEQTVTNHNKLLQSVEGCIGGKTGYTKEAGRCLATVVQREEGRLVCVTLGRSNDWQLHSEAYERWFEKERRVELLAAEDFVAEVPCASGTAQATVMKDVSVTLFGNEELPVIRLMVPSVLYGNKPKGSVIGRVEFVTKGVVFGDLPLILCDDLEEKIDKPSILLRIFRFFRRIFLKKS